MRMYRVFLVDDEPFIVEGLYDILDWSGMGLEIVGHAENGKKALDAVRVTPVDILITDIAMPEMTGLELIRKAREVHPELKVIILSGYNEFDYLKEGLHLGIENYLLKPINVEELKSTLAGTIEKLNAPGLSRLWSVHDIDMLRDSIAYRWVTDNISYPELEQRAALLGVRTDAPYFFVSILHADRDPDRLYEAVRREMGAGHADTLVFRNLDNDTGILFALDDPASGKEQARERLAGLRRKLPDDVRISLGDAVGGAENVHRSYAAAKKAREYFLVYPDENVIDAEQLPLKSAGLTRFPVDWTPYAKHILSKDKEKLLQTIRDDFERLKTREGLTPETVRGLAIEMIIRLKEELQKIKQIEMPDLYAEAIQQVTRAFHADELLEIVSRTAGKTIEAIVRDHKSPVIQEILKLIHESYADTLTLKWLGERFNIHPVYLGQLFHKETGSSFTDYVNRYRIEKAKELLRENTLKVHEIARKVGYWETGYFYRQFRKYTGLSPTEFKELR
jgi:two-component system response regulator YesN